MEGQQYTAVAKAARVFGKEGELMLNLYGTFPAEINKQEPVWAFIDALPVPFFFERFERRGQKGALAVLADIDTPARAEALLGLEFHVRSTDWGAEDDSDDIYLEDLVGYRAVVSIEPEDGGKPMRIEGEVTDFFDSELNPLLEVTATGRTMLIPAAAFITDVNPESRTAEFSLPESLADLN